MSSSVETLLIFPNLLAQLDCSLWNSQVGWLFGGKEAQSDQLDYDCCLSCSVGVMCEPFYSIISFWSVQTRPLWSERCLEWCHTMQCFSGTFWPIMISSQNMDINYCRHRGDESPSSFQMFSGNQQLLPGWYQPALTALSSSGCATDCKKCAVSLLTGVLLMDVLCLGKWWVQNLHELVRNHNQFLNAGHIKAEVRLLRGRKWQLQKCVCKGHLPFELSCVVSEVCL